MSSHSYTHYYYSDETMDNDGSLHSVESVKENKDGKRDHYFRESTFRDGKENIIKERGNKKLKKRAKDLEIQRK